MGWSVCLIKKKWMTDEVEIGNHTSNVYSMYKKAIGGSLPEILNGKKCKAVIPILCKGISEMEDNPKIYKLMNPPNNWGSYETALKFLIDILIACKKNPDYKIEVC